MDLTPYIETIRNDLTAAASAADEPAQRTAATLSATLEPSVRLALMHALSDLAAEVTASVPDQLVEVRLDGRDVRVVVTPTGETAEDPEPRTERAHGAEEPTAASSAAGDADGDISRITLRMLEQLKGQAEQAAAAQGVSLNTFVAQAVQGALHGAGRPRGPHRHRGPGGGDRRQGPAGGPGLRGWVQG